MFTFTAGQVYYGSLFTGAFDLMTDGYWLLQLREADRERKFSKNIEVVVDRGVHYSWPWSTQMQGGGGAEKSNLSYF